MFEKRKMMKRLRKVGASVDTTYLLYINNEEPISFPNKESVFDYIKHFREENAITKLQIFRIETYSL